MTTYELQRLVLAREDLSSPERFVGMVYALHLNAHTGQIRVRQETIAAECQMSARTVRQHLQALVQKGVFTSKRTGRATILSPAGVEPPKKARGRGNGRPPWMLDTEFSTRVEEEMKRPLYRS